MDNVILLEYQENFADNLSSIAYGKIIEKNTNLHCYLENDTKKRTKFENYMSNFNMEYNYISSARVKKISNNALKKNKSYIDNLIIDKKISEKKITNKILNLKHFKIKDIDYISDKIKDMLKFNRYDFLINHDILENILNTQSIGLYINENDILNKKEKDFIYQATKRLNKYIKKPKLYIFSKKDISNEIKFYVDYEIINLNDWREEFYFLTCCKHKIILNTKNSYSEGFWSAILNQKDYTINIYDKKLQDKKARKNWIAI